MTAFMLACYLNGALQGSIYFKSVADCTYYSENLSGQKLETQNGDKEYKCLCKLVPYVDENKVRVY
jgi:hypothetical protein